MISGKVTFLWRTIGTIRRIASLVLTRKLQIDGLRLVLGKVGTTIKCCLDLLT